MKVLFLTSGRRAPSSRFRVLQWIPHLRAAGVRCHIAAAFPDKYDSLAWLGWRGSCALRRCLRFCDLTRARLGAYDVVFVERELFNDATYDLEGRFRHAARSMVLDVDDAIFLLHPEKFSRLAAMSDVVIAGNTLLQIEAAKHNEHVVVVPTCIDTEVYELRKFPDIASHRLSIGWTGTSSNLPYLVEVTSTLRELSLRYDYQFTVMSDRADPLAKLDLSRVDIRFVRWSPRVELDTISAFDVGIMPLADDAWTRHKCGLKALQCMAVGMPVVASPVGVNTEIMSDGGGFLADTERQWFWALDRLLSDSKLRWKLGLRARATVEARYSVQANLPKLLAALEQAAETGRRRS